MTDQKVDDQKATEKVDEEASTSAPSDSDKKSVTTKDDKGNDSSKTTTGSSPKKEVRPPRRPGAARMTEPSSKALGMFQNYAPYHIGPWTTFDKESWCLSVLRTEASLRREESYLERVGEYFDQGLTPPIAICEEVEEAALRAHGYDPTVMLEPYRFAARSLSEAQRGEIFFLRANDELFRPKAAVLGAAVSGEVVNCQLQTVNCKDVLFDQARTLVIAASTS